MGCHSVELGGEAGGSGLFWYGTDEWPGVTKGGVGIVIRWLMAKMTRLEA